MKSDYDLTGEKFGRLKVLRQVPVKAGHRKRRTWECKCSCGTKCILTSDKLKSGHTKSCGCLRNELISQMNLSHGEARDRKLGQVYRVWIEMKQRCYNPKNNRYYCYGARGIKVCRRWLNSFENFAADMGPRPQKRTGCRSEYSLERKNGSGNYTPSNCIWTTKKRQARNKSNNRMLTLDGKTMCITAWLEKYGIGHSTLYARLARGMTISEAFKTPIK